MTPQQLIETVRLITNAVQTLPRNTPRDRAGFLLGLAYAFAQHDGVTAEQFLTDAQSTTRASLPEQVQATAETFRVLEASEASKTDRHVVLELDTNDPGIPELLAALQTSGMTWSTCHCGQEFLTRETNEACPPCRGIVRGRT